MTEGSKTGKTDSKVCQHTEGPMHNCAYVDGRNRLTLIAYRWANEQVPADRFGNNWSRLFSEKMTELVAQAMREGKL